MRFLIFGDVVGKPGRRAIDKALPLLKEEFEPDMPGVMSQEYHC